MALIWNECCYGIGHELHFYVSLTLCRVFCIELFKDPFQGVSRSRVQYCTQGVSKLDGASKQLLNRPLAWWRFLLISASIYTLDLLSWSNQDGRAIMLYAFLIPFAFHCFPIRMRFPFEVSTPCQEAILECRRTVYPCVQDIVGLCLKLIFTYYFGDEIELVRHFPWTSSWCMQWVNVMQTTRQLSGCSVMASTVGVTITLL